MSNQKEKPLVTFALFAYNQEKFIREAVEAALAQDYEPLEIILSDDASDDRTFEIMHEMASDYSGPHIIKLNRNTTNLGIAAHLNSLMKMVGSDFVVVAAGDDISFPARTSESVKCWLASSRKALSIHSSALEIDGQGELTGKVRRGGENKELNDPGAHASHNIGVLGAAHAWDMRLIREFPPILSTIVNEDIILPSRAALVGSVFYIDRPLVKYRTSIGVSHEVSRRRELGKYDLTVPLMRRIYGPFLQKTADYKSVGRYKEYGGLIAVERAKAYFPIWLKVGYFSRRKFSLFFIRCGFCYLLYEYTKYKIPRLVALKQTVQFKVIGELKSIIDRCGLHK